MSTLNLIAETNASVTNSAITVGFLSNILLLNCSAGILDINMGPQGNGFNRRPRSRWGLKRRAFVLHQKHALRMQHFKLETLQCDYCPEILIHVIWHQKNHVVASLRQKYSSAK